LHAQLAPCLAINATWPVPDGLAKSRARTVTLSAFFFPEPASNTRNQRRSWLGWAGIAGKNPASLNSAARAEAVTFPLPV